MHLVLGLVIGCLGALQSEVSRVVLGATLGARSAF